MSLLFPVEIELVLILKNNYLYPKNKEELLNCIEELDKDIMNRERVLSKTYLRCANIYDYFKDYTEEQVTKIISHIL